MRAAAEGEPAAVAEAETGPARIAVLLLFAAPFVLFWKGAIGRVLLAPSDALLYFFPVRVLTARLLRSGVLPLWNPFIFSGVPYLGEIQTAVLYPFNVLFLVLPPLWAMNLQMITTYSIAALGMYAYTRAVGCSVLGASVGALAFAFNGFTMGHFAHTGVIQGAAWLPVLLYCLERLRGSLRWRFVAGGAAAVAVSVFAGHPQMPFNLLFIGALYGIYFALVGGAPVGRWRYLAVTATTLGAGVLLSAVQLVPTAELGALSVRADLSFQEFSLFSLPLSQIPMLLAPFLFGGVGGARYWGVGGIFHELLGYLGLVPLTLVLAAAPLLRRDRWAWFWVGLATFAFLMALGPATPLSWAMYHVPVYNLFRGAGRHFLPFDLAVAALAAWGLTHLGRVDRRWVIAAALLVGGAVLLVVAMAACCGERIWAGLVAVTTPGGFGNPALADAFVFLSPALALPAGMAVLSAVAVIALARQPSAPRAVFLVAVHALDLMVFASLVPHTAPSPEQATAVPDFLRYLTGTDPGPAGYRLGLAYAGAHQPARYDFALSNVPIINGYEPLELARYSRLTGMTYYGVIGDSLIVTRPGVLDVLNARYLAVVYPGRVASAAPEFARQPIDLELRAGERLDFVLPSDCPATALAVVSGVRGGAVPDGTAVARLQAFGQDGEAIERVMLMGRHTAGWEGAADRAAPPLPVFEREDLGSAAGTTYLARFDWQPPLAVRRVSIEALAPGAALRLTRVALYDAVAGASCPLTALHTLRSASERWERVYGDATLDLLRNRKSLPRAWLVPQALALEPEDIVLAIQFGRLPDGRAFDPRAVALIDGASGFDVGRLDAAAAVEVTTYEPNAIELRSRSSTPAFLVLSEIFYPGWEAEIDGAGAPTVRTDYVLRGLALPAGEHRIRFVYRPRSVAVGTGISAAVLLALLASGTVRLRRHGAAPGG